MRAMTSRLAGPRALIAALAVTVGLAGLPLTVPTARAATEFCALMADAIGLYPGNNVTQMGVQIGSVSSVEAFGDGVKVHFTTGGRTLPADVKAVTRSTSILADRSLEMVGNYASGPKLNASTCIPRGRTATPKSISETTTAATNLIQSLTEGGNAANMQKLTTVLERQLKPGVGPLLHRSLTDFSTLLSDPSGFLGDVRTVVSNLDPLAGQADQQWPELMLTLQHAKPVLDSYGEVTFPAVKEIYTILPTFFAVGDDIIRRYGDQLRPAADAGVSAVKLAASGVRSNEDVAAMLPAFGAIIAPYLPRGDRAAAPGSNTAPLRLPVSKIATTAPHRLCTRINRQSPGACAVVDGAAQIADVDLLQLVLAQGGHR